MTTRAKDDVVTTDPLGLRRGSARVYDAFAWAILRLNHVAAVAYLGAGSLIGFEGLVLLLGYGTALPIAVPVTIAVLAVVYFLRRSPGRWRRRPR